MNYGYIALEKDNRLVRGAIEAGSVRLVEDWLAQAGLRIVSIRPITGPATWRRLVPQTSGVTRKDLVLFSEQLATLLNAGTSLVTALRLLADQSRGAAFKTVLTRVINDVRSGMPLHEAMSKAPKIFPQVYVQMIAASERSGTLESTLRHLAAYLQREIALVQQVRKALTYPAIVALVGIVVVGILVTVVLPALAETLNSLNAHLPLITRLVIGFSNLVQAWKLPALLSLIVLAGLGAWYVSKPSGRKEIDRRLLRAPWLGRVLVQMGLGRFSRNMALLLNAGLPMPECLALARFAFGNKAFQEAIMRVRAMVLEGSSLGQAFGAIPFIPGLYVQLIRVGEETGALETNLNALADVYEREVEDHLSTVTSLVEPALTLVMGVITGGLALSVLLPLLSIMDSLQTP